MKHRCIVTIQKHNSSPYTGKSPSSPRTKKAKQVGSKLKSMLVIFFHCENTIHQEVAPPSQTVNQHYYYWKVSQHLRERVHWKHLEWQQNQDWLIHLHYVLEHIAVWVQEMSPATNIILVPCPSHSPDMVPWDFSCFQEQNHSYKNIIFRTFLQFCNNHRHSDMKFRKVSSSSGTNDWPIA